jgi:NifB/MoaA-like Fe-S oxidoreductase
VGAGSERILSLSVVPVGLTRYNLGKPVRLLTAGRRTRSPSSRSKRRARGPRERGTGWVYAADELFLLADLPVPPADYYDDWPLTENGVGAVRALLADVEALIADPRAGRPPDRPGHGQPHGRGAGAAPGAHGSAATGGGARPPPVENRLFGPTVTTAGLLPGADILAAVGAAARRTERWTRC